MSALIVPMCAYFQTLKGQPSGIALIDSTSLKLDSAVFNLKDGTKFSGFLYQ